jgi:hypothetical protein
MTYDKSVYLKDFYPLNIKFTSCRVDYPYIKWGRLMHLYFCTWDRSPLGLNFVSWDKYSYYINRFTNAKLSR